MSTRLLLILFFTLNAFQIAGQENINKGTIYCIPGQGSDSRLFDSLAFPEGWQIRFLEYGTPDKKESLQNFAKKLSARIDTTESFVIIGVSLGGMIAVEIHEQLRAQQCIIISSAKNRNELPFRYRFQRNVPLYKLIPRAALLAGAKMLQPIVEPDRKKNKHTFKKMLKAKNATYMKRSIAMLIGWERTENSKKIIHIHGTKDHTLPLRKIKNANYIIKEGSHMMTLTRAKEISTLLNEILNDK